MLRLLMVTGESLSPLYQEGDYVVLTTIPFFIRRIKPKDTIVLWNSKYGTMIKQVDHLDYGRKAVFVIGMKSESVDSRQFGLVDLKDVIGKVIWHISKPGK